MTMLNDVACRILSELEEAHEENISTLMNTVLSGFGGQNELNESIGALEELVQLNFVCIGYRRQLGEKLTALPRAESLAVIRTVPGCVAFDEDRRLWLWDKSKPRAYIMTTPIGLEKAREILEERGHSWWCEA